MPSATNPADRTRALALLLGGAMLAGATMLLVEILSAVAAMAAP